MKVHTNHMLRYCDHCFGQATLILRMGTKLVIEDTHLYFNSTRTLMSYKDIRHKGFHVETHNDNDNEYPFIIKITDISSKCLKEFLQHQPDRISHTSNPYKCCEQENFQNLDILKIWHYRSSHPGIWMT